MADFTGTMKQALKQQGFEGLGRKQTEWTAWMEREKEALMEIAQAVSYTHLDVYKRQRPGARV